MRRRRKSNFAEIGYYAIFKFQLNNPSTNRCYNEIEVIKNHVAEIFIIADMGGLQPFQMGIIFVGAIPFNDFMPDGIDKGVEALNLYGGNPIHINLNICKKLDKVLIGGKFAEQTVVNPTAQYSIDKFNTAMEKAAYKENKNIKILINF